MGVIATVVATVPPESSAPSHIMANSGVIQELSIGHVMNFVRFAESRYAVAL